MPPKIAGVVGGMLSATQDDWQPPSEAVFNIVLENSSGGEIGITLTDSGQGESDFLGQYRAEVRKVLAGSPGDKAGLQVGGLDGLAGSLWPCILDPNIRIFTGLSLSCM